jgi:hypothetical protein
VVPRPPEAPEENLLYAALEAWAQACPRPLVPFFDEIDALRGQSLISVLRQLRAGFSERPVAFPASVALCGLRDVRNYRAASGGDPRHGRSPRAAGPRRSSTACTHRRISRGSCGGGRRLGEVGVFTPAEALGYLRARLDGCQLDEPAGLARVGRN